MKGTIRPDHIPKNKFTLRIIGLPEIVFTKVDGLEEELEVVDIPDRTKASGGQTKAGEFTATVPEHHFEQVQALRNWLVDSTDPVSPDYKKTGVLTRRSITGLVNTRVTILGLFPFKEAGSESDMSDEGNMSELVFSFSFDDLVFA